MKAYVLHGVDDFIYEEIPTPKPQQGEVLIKVYRAGICGSDIARVYKTGTYHFPTIPGHEFAGVVEYVGEKVDSKWMGKRVGVFPLIPCNSCPSCIAKKYEMCDNYNYLGSRSDGGFAEYVVAPEWNLIAIPNEIDMSVAAMLEPICVAIHAIRQTGGCKYKEFYKDKKVAVCGMGTIGKIIVLLLNLFGCNNIVVIDKNNHSNEFVDVFFECVGKNETIIRGIENLKPGGALQLVGNPYGDISLEKSIYWRILRKQLTLRGSWNSSFTHELNDDWNVALEIVKNNQEQFKTLVSHSLSLRELEKGLQIMRDKTEKYTKVMVNVQEESG